MAIKFYSDKTNKYYPTAEAAEKAEFELKEQENRERAKKEREARLKKEKEEKLAAERKARAAEVEDARKVMVAAQSKYREVLDAFVRDYNSFHFSIDSDDVKSLKNTIPTLFELFDLF